MLKCRAVCFSFFMFFLIWASTVVAQPASFEANQVALEKHVMILAQELRCLVCQNQTIADSNADLAIDLRNQIREQLVKGMSDQQIMDFMVQRYGDFILYRPPVKSTTWILWFGPLALFIGGILFLLIKLRRQTSATSPYEISESDLRHAETLLLSDSKNGESI